MQIMMMLFENPPSIGQFALNGIWEKALSFGVDKPPSIDELREYLAGKNELAFELFFGASFFGVRFIGTPALILELSQHCLICLNNSLDADSFITAVGNHASCGELCHEVTHMEVGAINAWKSVGSYLLPTPAQTLGNIDELWSEICATQLTNDVKHPKAVEFVYTDPRPHWLGFPISIQQPPYSLSKEMLREVLQKFTANCG
jgi:hypothetical protein